MHDNVDSEGMSEWLSDLGSQALAFVDSVADSVGEGLQNATSELEEENARLRAEEASKKGTHTGDLTLPWESNDESLAILSQDVMERIFKLSMAEGNFAESPSSMEQVPVEFDFQAFIPIALKILELDSNLARMHARLMPRMEEEDFWRNYHYRARYLRARVGLDGEEDKNGALGSISETDLRIYEPEVLPPKRVVSTSKGFDGHELDGAIENPATQANKDEEEEKELTEEEKAELATKRRKEEEAALAAEVEAELLKEDISGVDLGDLNLDDEEALEKELNGDDLDLDGVDLDNLDLDDLDDD